MKFELDISLVENLKYSDKLRNFKIPCKYGEHQLDFDVIECDVPKDIYKEMIYGRSGDIESLPIGFDEFPVGATLTRVS